METELSNNIICITLLGPAMSGKTTIANLIVNNIPVTDYVHTITPELYYYTLQSSSDSTSKHIEIEDTTLEIDYKMFYSVNKINKNLLYKNSLYKPMCDKRHYFLVVFDSNNVNSWINARNIFNDVRNHNQILHGRDPFIAIVAHKTDKSQSSPLIDEAEAFANMNNVFLFKTSTEDREMVRKMIRELVAQLDF